MKHIFLTISLFLSTIFYVQAQGGRGGRSPQNQNRQPRVESERKEVKASDLAGIFYYDVKSTLKKVKIKDDDIKVKVSNALKKYNTKIKEISFLNSDKFKGINVLMKSLRENRTSNNGKANKNSDLRKKIGEVIRPIRKEIRAHEMVLNETLEGILTQKQIKKWLKYQKKEKDKLKPQRQERNKNRQQPQNQNRQRRY
ncbi:hypothetical protein [Polaribacter aquimarinus]|uniref:hypothetical protein n=1 Tax=Polaribacter aquimarinus TaxID=2100726 RepID=UPI0011B1CD56|nr:hypothetical protein [Polaribacter aquimarinus]